MGCTQHDRPGNIIRLSPHQRGVGEVRGQLGDGAVAGLGLAQGLLGLALPPAERAAMGERARAAVLARYTTRAMQEATLAVYRELP